MRNDLDQWAGVIKTAGITAGSDVQPSSEPGAIEIRDTVRDFVAREIKPARAQAASAGGAASVRSADGARSKPRSSACARWRCPKSAGGAGADNLTCCIVTEELAAGDPDIAAVLAQTWTLAHVLFDRADDAGAARALLAGIPRRPPLSSRASPSTSRIATPRSASTITGPTAERSALHDHGRALGR